MREFQHLQQVISTGAELCGSSSMRSWVRKYAGANVKSSDLALLDVSTLFTGMTPAAARKAAVRCSDNLEREMLNSPSTSQSVAPRLRHAAEICRRLFAAEMLLRTDGREFSKRHIRYIIRNATNPSQILLRTHAAFKGMEGASLAGDLTEVQFYADLMQEMLGEVELIRRISAITSTLRAIGIQRTTRVDQHVYASAIRAAAEILAQRTSSYPDSAVVGIGLLAALYCQFTGKYEHGMRWIRAQERAYKRLNQWNSSTMRENFLIRFTVELRTSKHTAAIETAQQLLDSDTPGSSSWFNLISRLCEMFIRDKAYEQAATLLMTGISHQNYRRMYPSLRRILLFTAGYLAVLTNSEPLWSTYERRRRMDRITPSRFFHHRVIDILRMLQQHNPDVVEATQNLASQLQRAPSSLRPKGVKEFIDVIRSAHAQRPVRRARTSELDHAEFIEEIVPWSALVAYAKEAIATPKITRRKGRTR